MRKFFAVVLSLLLIVTFVNIDVGLADEMEFESSSVIGYGPIGSQMLAPGCIGIDENGKIYVVDRETGSGSVYLNTGTLFKPFKLPSSVLAKEIKTGISVRMGNVCYTTNDYVTVAATNGDIVNRIGAGANSHISSPLAAFLLNDLSILVADKSEGMVLYDSQGEYIKRPINIGVDVPNIVAADVSRDGAVAILSVVESSEEIIDPSKMEPNEIKITLFDNSHRKTREINIIATSTDNPKKAKVRFDKNGDLYFLPVDSGLSAKYSKSGSLIASLGFSIGTKTDFVATSKKLFFVNSENFYTADENGNDIKIISKFEPEPMQFHDPKSIATCAGDGLAVYDIGKGLVQFFDKNGASGNTAASKQTVMPLSTNTDKQVVGYSKSDHELVVFRCGGMEEMTIKLEADVPEINALSPGLKGEFWTLSTLLGRVTRINKGGLYVDHFGGFGAGEGQFLKPVDLVYGLDGNIYVLDSEDGMVKVFNKEGEFQRSFGDNLNMKNPSGICITEDLTLVVSDTGNNKIHFFEIGGKHLYSKGGKTPNYTKVTIDDYWKHLGTFNEPTKLATSGGKIYILDSGNQRVQIFEKGVVKPVLSVDKSDIIFPESKSGILEETFTVSNSSGGNLSGSIETDAAWLRVSENTFDGNLIVKVMCDVSKLSAWGEVTGTITIKSNGGNKTIECKASRVGNLIELQINSNTAKINGESQSVDPAPVIKSGSTVVPLRFIGEALGAGIEWDGADKKVTYKLEGREVILWVGVSEAMVNGEIVSMSVAPMIINGRTVVPLRFISEALGASVEWIGATKSIKIYYPVNPNIG